MPSEHRDTVHAALVARERSMSTGMEQGIALQQFPGRGRVAFADGIEFRAIPVIIALCEDGEIDQRIGHAAHGRDHDAETCIGHLEDDPRYPTKTRGVSEAAAAELMNFPAIFRHFFYSALSENRA